MTLFFLREKIRSYYEKGVVKMVLFTLLLIVVVIMIALAILTVCSVGAAGIIIFAEPIICLILIVLIIRWIVKRKRK